ncbi:MAG: hypothetical protein WCV72_00830 [Patescibacteria group bacterium]|jgi:hypothetical protein
MQDKLPNPEETLKSIFGKKLTPAEITQVETIRSQVSGTNKYFDGAKKIEETGDAIRLLLRKTKK